MHCIFNLIPKFTLDTITLFLLNLNGYVPSKFRHSQNYQGLKITRLQEIHFSAIEDLVYVKAFEETLFAKC